MFGFKREFGFEEALKRAQEAQQNTDAQAKRAAEQAKSNDSETERMKELEKDQAEAENIKRAKDAVKKLGDARKEEIRVKEYLDKASAIKQETLNNGGAVAPEVENLITQTAARINILEEESKIIADQNPEALSLLHEEAQKAEDLSNLSKEYSSKSFYEWQKPLDDAERAGGFGEKAVFTFKKYLEDGLGLRSDSDENQNDIFSKIDQLDSLKAAFGEISVIAENFPKIGHFIGSDNKCKIALDSFLKRQMEHFLTTLNTRVETFIKDYINLHLHKDSGEERRKDVSDTIRNFFGEKKEKIRAAVRTFIAGNNERPDPNLFREFENEIAGLSFESFDLKSPKGEIVYFPRIPEYILNPFAFDTFTPEEEN